MSGKQPLKSGEKILMIVFGVFLIFAIIGYMVLETMRQRSPTPMFANTTHFDFSPIGAEGSKIYRESNCNSCHRALRNGTSMGLSLDGLGSRRSLEWIERFLRNPEETYGARTLDHGPAPKEAAYISRIPEQQLHKVAVFLSELKADAGSSVARMPPPERSEAIESMLRNFAPEGWKEKYKDVRDFPPQSNDSPPPPPMPADPAAAGR